MKFLMEYKWRPSTSARKEFAQKMNEIDEFCKKNNIHQSLSSDSYYFNLNGKDYRVSNHTVSASNKGAYDSDGNKIRDEYHPDGEESDVVYITAGKTRLIDIYNDLKNGYKLDRRGNRIISEDYNTQDISNDSYIDVTKQEISDYQDYLDNPKKANEYNKTTSQIVGMSPREYFEECAKIFNSTFEKQYRQIELDKETIEYLKNVIIKLKKKFPIVVLNYAKHTQEGRHRMFTLGELFGWDEHKYPVLIIEETEEGIKYKKENEIYKTLRDISNKQLKYTYTSLDNFIIDLKYAFQDNIRDYLDTYITPDITEYNGGVRVTLDGVNYDIDEYEIKIDPNKEDDDFDIDNLDIEDLLSDEEYKELINSIDK